MNQRYSKKLRKHRDILKLFSAFGNRIEDYDSPPKDTGYWYGERALTGFLAAAAWSLPRGWSLEEFTGLRQNGKKKGSGRGDIWIGVGSRTYTIEAKASWPGGDVEDAIRGAEAKLGEAANQLSKLEETYQEGKPVALCYIIPDLNDKGRFADPVTIDDFFTNMPMRLSDSRTVVAPLWYGKKQYPSHNGRIYPGVILVARLLPGWS